MTQPKTQPTTELGKMVNALAKEILVAAPSVPDDEQPVFSAVLGTVSLADITDGQQLYEQESVSHRFLSINVLDTFQTLTKKSPAEFTQDDIHASMFLANLLAVGAFHQKKSIRTDLGCLESEEVSKILTAMKHLGYKTEVHYLANEQAEKTWHSLSEQEQWIVYNKDCCNRDLILYMYEDVVGIKFDDIQSLDLDKVVIHR